MSTGAEGQGAGGGRPAPSYRPRTSSPVLIALISLLAISGGLLLIWGSKLTFLLDDWEFLFYRPGFDAHSILEPHGEHIVVLPMLIYKGLLATFGLGSAFPFRVVSTVLFLLSATLLFEFLRRRVGGWPALAGTAVVLFLGAASEDLLWAFQMGYFGCMAAGLGALLTLERNDRRGDVLTALLLTVAVLFSSLGIPFVIAVAVEVLRRRDRWSRVYVLAVPVFVYAIWWLGWGHNAETAFSAGTLAQTPAYVLNGVAASISALTGLSLPTEANPGGGDWGRILIVVGLAATGWWLHRLGRLPRWLWLTIALGGSFWILAGLNQEPGRDPTSSRYMYVGAIFVLLFAAELLRGVRIGRRATWIVLAVAAAAVLPNLYLLHASYDNYHRVSQLEKAGLGAIDLAESDVKPYFILTKGLIGTNFIHVEAGAYLDAKDDYGGTPGYSAAELENAPSAARYAADKTLFAAFRVHLDEISGSEAPRPSSAPTLPAESGGFAEIPAGGCATVPPEPNSPQLILPRGGVVIEAGGAPIRNIKLARFASKFPVEFSDGIEAGQAGELAIPADASSKPWQMRLESGVPTVVCALDAG